MAALTALLLLSFRFSSLSRTRKISFFAALVALLISAGSFGFAWTQRINSQKMNTAIVMRPVSTVRSSPDNSGNTLFILHEGTKLEILENDRGLGQELSCLTADRVGFHYLTLRSYNPSLESK